MESAHTLCLDEEALARNAEQKRPIFVLEWLRYLDKNMVTISKGLVKENQKKLVDQLFQQINNSPGPPCRKLLARNMATLFSIGDTFLLFEAVNKCNDVLKIREDSQNVILAKLATIACIGEMFCKLGRLMGRSYEDTVAILIKMLKSADSQTRCEIYVTLSKMMAGMGNAAGSVHRDVFKTLRHGLTDRVMPVRAAAATCLKEMIPHASFLYTTDLDSVFSLCFRAFDGSNYEVRCAVSQAVGCLIATTLSPTTRLSKDSKLKLASLDDLLNLLSTGFLKGGIGFLKTGATDMIKGSSTVPREIRVGVAHSYVTMIAYLGNVWLEKNMALYITHLLDLLTNPKASSSHMDAVYSRRCVSFILRRVLGRELSEKAQIQAIKELVANINSHISPLPIRDTEAKEVAVEPMLIQHLLICALTEIGYLVERLGTCSASVMNEAAVGFIDTVVSVLTHGASAARLAAAWCLRCIAVAAPSQLTPLIERCLERLETLKSSTDALYGYSAALSALLGAASQTPLGIPHNKGKLIFSIAEDLLRSASQNSRLSLQRTQAGWLLIGAIMSLGPSVVRGLVPRMLLLWKNSFPRSNKELESEKARGDAFTWQVTLENRAGALAAMSSFIAHCKCLVTEDVTRRLIAPIESAINMLATLGSSFKNQGPVVKVSAVMVRLRLFKVLLLLPSNCMEASFTALLRLLVTEITLTDTAANTSTSLLERLCHAGDDVILGSWIIETDHRLIEDQVRPGCGSGSSALEHDMTALYFVPKRDDDGCLPLGVAVIDKSCEVYAHIFPHITNKHKAQMFGHFADCIKHAKAARQEVVQVNCLAAVLGGIKSVRERKASIEDEDVKSAAISLLSSMLSHGNVLIRCASAQALGIVGKVIKDGKALSEITQMCFDKVKVARDASSRTGYSLTLGYLHSIAGSVGSSQQLNTTISILLALSQDNASPVVQSWALHSLTLIADSGGPAFTMYVEPCLSQSQRLLMNVPAFNTDVHQTIGRLLAAIATSVGPEMQVDIGNNANLRNSLLFNCAIMLDHEDFLVRKEAITVLQQLHMFAAQHIDLSVMVPLLCSSLVEEHLFLRRAALSCLHQLIQRNAEEVNEYVYSWTKARKLRNGRLRALFQNEHGLLGATFAMLDYEDDALLRTLIMKSITSLIQSTAVNNLQSCIALCKEVLTSSDSNSNVSSPDKDIEEGEDDEAKFKAGDEPNSHPALLSKWRTKVYASQTLCRIVNACETSHLSDVHFDLSLARERSLASKGKKSYLVLHLSDLIRMTFMAATSESDQLRLEGLKALQLIIDKFSKVPEPEFPNHVILEQYQAQVGAALRPAFTPDTPSHVTAAACQVCSAWIGSGVARDLNDLRRVHQLLVSSLAKLQKESSSRQFNEAASTLEKLAILKAWAEVYVVAMKKEEESEQKKLFLAKSEEDDLEINESLLQLVTPELRPLSNYWLSALKDHALLTLPQEFSGQLPHDGGAFYTSDTIEMARPRYRNSWPPILHAAALWLCSNDFTLSSSEGDLEDKQGKSNFHLLFGICMEALCDPKSTDPHEIVLVALESLQTLFSHHHSRLLIAKDKQLAIELCSVLHRLLITRETISCQLLILNISLQVVKAFEDSYDEEKRARLREVAPANQKPNDTDSILAVIGEGHESGEIVPGETVTYSLLQIALCVLVRQLPEISPLLTENPDAIQVTKKRAAHRFSEETTDLISKSVKLLTCLPNICTAKGTLAILPSLLFLLTGVYGEIMLQDNAMPTAPPTSTILECLEIFCTSPFNSNSVCGSQWVEILQSTFARILDVCKTSDDQIKPDQVTALVTIGLFVTKASAQVVKPANLQFPCINFLKQCLQSAETTIQVHCLKTLDKIFGHQDTSVSYPYIHALAPRVIELLTCETSLLVNLSTDKHEVLMQALAVLETLVEIVNQVKKVDLLRLYVPILINLLTENMEVLKGKTHRTSIHNYALKKLTAIGPTYPNEFRQIISQAPVYRTKLETAIRNQHNSAQQQHFNAANSSDGSSLPNETRQQSTRNENPIIKLKTDFSNYSEQR
ncbi:HEAT repeat-containing protein 5B [Halotydeus destructor]|nr:HEAT repeat-containing protein 5B [Halotydeus destructor]